MTKFITGKDLEDAVYDIIWKAEKILLIVSPYVRLDDYFKKLFDNHINNPKLHIVLVFGKNETEVSKSLSKNDFDFFKKFLNISVIYVPNLHAKYYGNEKQGVITSINLYDFSFKNNIEFGVFSELNILNKLISSTEEDAWNTCWEIAEQNEVVFIKRPVYEKKILSSLLGKNYIKSDILHDTTDRFYSLWKNNQSSIQKTILDFPDEIDLGSENSVRPNRQEEYTQKGFCIRSGIEIPFNTKKPFTLISYRSWAQYSNPDFPEKYCHKTGKPSNGKTSFRNPIL